MPQDWHAVWRGFILTAGLIGLVTAAHESVWLGTGQAQTEPGDAPVLELAERLIAPTRLGPGAQPLSVQLLPGQIPSDLPVAIALLPDQRLLGSAVRRAGEGVAGAT